MDIRDIHDDTCVLCGGPLDDDSAARGLAIGGCCAANPGPAPVGVQAPESAPAAPVHINHHPAANEPKDPLSIDNGSSLPDPFAPPDVGSGRKAPARGLVIDPKRHKTLAALRRVTGLDAAQFVDALGASDIAGVYVLYPKRQQLIDAAERIFPRVRRAIAIKQAEKIFAAAKAAAMINSPSCQDCGRALDVELAGRCQDCARDMVDRLMPR